MPNPNPAPNPDPQKHTISINLPGLLRMLGENICAERTITIADNGAGMTEAELHKNFALTSLR